MIVDSSLNVHGRYAYYRLRMDKEETLLILEFIEKDEVGYIQSLLASSHPMLNSSIGSWDSISEAK